MTEEKLMALLKDMSLKEKIGQMMQLDVCLLYTSDAADEL